MDKETKDFIFKLCNEVDEEIKNLGSFSNRKDITTKIVKYKVMYDLSLIHI